MKLLGIDEIIAAIGGRPLGEPPGGAVGEVCIDSRKVVERSIFFAIRGEQHDGHDFVPQALASGAVAAICADASKLPGQFQRDGRIITVGDTTEALGRLAAWYRKQLAAQVIAVAGSNGKTTTKDILTTVLSTRRRGRGAAASFNNSIGVPLTLLSVEASDEFVVVEIGTNHPGEIRALGRIARPNIAVITSIGEEHLEFFGNVEAVAKEEMSLLSCLRDHGFVTMSEDAARYAAPEDLKSRGAVIYGLTEECHLRAEALTCDANGQRFLLNGRREFHVPLLGAHNAVNALAAIAVGTRLRMTEEEIAAGLTQVKPTKMRLESASCGEITLINDAYNANPASVRAALAVLDEFTGVARKVLILGDMRELGAASEREHTAIGREAGRSSAQVIMAAGSFARFVADGAASVAGTTKRVYSFQNLSALTDRLESLVEPGDLVLLKASRAGRFEQLIPRLEEIGRRVPARA